MKRKGSAAFLAAVFIVVFVALQSYRKWAGKGLVVESTVHCQGPPLAVVDVDYSIAKGTPIPIPWIPRAFREAQPLRDFFVGHRRLFWPPADLSSPWNPSSSALIKRPDGGFWVLSRHVNYFIQDDGPEFTKRRDVPGYPTWSSRTFLVQLDEQLQDTATTEVVLPGAFLNRSKEETAVGGLEDPRVVAGQWTSSIARSDEVLWFTAGQQQMVANWHKSANFQRVAAFALNLTSGTLMWGKSLASPLTKWQEREKNWLPFVAFKGSHLRGWEILAIYEFHPFTVLNLSDVFTTTVHPAEDLTWDGVKVQPIKLGYETVDTPSWFRSLRGSAGPIVWQPYNDARRELFLIAHAHDDKGIQTFYTHRFISLDPVSLKPLRVSGPLLFHSRRTEFVVGLESSASSCCGIGRQENSFILSYSIMDSEAWVGRLCFSIVNGLLKTRGEDPHLWAVGLSTLAHR